MRQRFLLFITVLLVVAACMAAPASVQHAQAPPTPLERATVSILFGSSSVSMVPVWITASCTTAGTCREVNPVMARLIGQGPVRAALVKASVSGATHYLVWRLPSTPRRQRWLRFGLAGTLLAVNVADAVHDVRVLRRLEQRGP